jgi:cell division protein FtsL
MSAVPVRSAGTRPRLAVVRGARRLPRIALAPWLLYTALLALAFLGLVYSQSSLNTKAIELSQIQAQTRVAEAQRDALRLEVARLAAPDRVITRAEELGMTLPDVPLRTLLVDTGRRPAPTAAASP